MRDFLLIVFLGLATGCSSGPRARDWDTRPTREFTLSKRHPQDDLLKVRLVAVAEDGTTTIQVLQTGETLRAARGDFFVPGHFGRHGLQLLGSSPEKQEALLLRIGGK